MFFFQKKRFFEFLFFSLKSSFLWSDQVQRAKQLLFRIQHQSFWYKNDVFPLFDDFVKKVKNSYFFTIFRIFFDLKHSKTF
jgi:hypothetical protein